MARTFRILLIDDIHPDALKHFYRQRPDAKDWSYYLQRNWLLEQCHGTTAAWERALVQLGNETFTLIDNQLGCMPDWTMHIPWKPEVIIVQNVGKWQPDHFFNWRARKIAMCSYAADIERLKGFDLVTTSFPWAVDEWKAEGINAVYLPLACDPYVLQACKPHPERTIPISFVGGLGYDHLWKRGTETMEKVGQQLGVYFRWYGYRPKNYAGPIYDGEAWGLNYHKRLLQSRVSLNRHGEISRGFSHNMRLFEIAHSGACLVTEHSPNISEFFEPDKECVTYKTADGLVEKLRWLLRSPDFVRSIGMSGHFRACSEHTYRHRAIELMKMINEL